MERTAADVYDVAIVGGGFAGTMVAVNVARMSARALRIALIDRDGAFGRGAAYGATCDEHVLNVPAAMMGAFPEDPRGFLEWIRATEHPDEKTAAAIGDGDFVARGIYGSYVRSLLDAACDAQTIDRIACDVVDIRREDGRMALVARDGSLACVAQTVVLALGSLAQDPPTGDGAASVIGDPRYAADPWKFLRAPSFEGSGETLLVGTGLTSLDVILSFHRSKSAGSLVALSRHGRFPLPHAGHATPIDPFEGRALPLTALEALRCVRAALHPDAIDTSWRRVIDGVRPRVSEVWGGWPERERARFLRHLRAFWEYHRHRAPGASAAVKDELLASGKLRVIAGRFLGSFECADGSIGARYVDRATGAERELHVSRIVNCRGVAGEYGTREAPVIANPAERGELARDPLGMGIRALPDGRLLDGAGNVAPNLRAIGWPLRGVLYETTAVRELRVRAKMLAEDLLRERDEAMARPKTRS